MKITEIKDYDDGRFYGNIYYQNDKEIFRTKYDKDFKISSIFEKPTDSALKER